MDPIANSPEVIEVTEGDVFYSGLKGYPIAKTALSTFLPGSIADFMNGLLPSQYHWTVFRFEVPNYVNYYGYAEGDFEGENFYRIYVGKIDTYNYITFMEISRIEEINVFEASAYVLGHALPFGNVIYRILSIAFLIPALFLAIGAILSFAGRREEEPEWEAKVKPREEAPETIAQQTSMAGEQATAPKQVEMAQLRMEIEELETRYDLGDISLDEYEKKRDSLTAALRTRQGELLRKRELLNTKKEELEVRWLIEEVSKEDYDRRTKVIKTEMERIRNELDSIEKWLRQMGPKSL